MNSTKTKPEETLMRRKMRNRLKEMRICHCPGCTTSFLTILHAGKILHVHHHDDTVTGHAVDPK